MATLIRKCSVIYPPFQDIKLGVSSFNVPYIHTFSERKNRVKKFLPPLLASKNRNSNSKGRRPKKSDSSPLEGYPSSQELDLNLDFDFGPEFGSLEPLGLNEPEYQPWLGAIIFKRNSTQTQFQYFTSLERLGLGNLSSFESSSLSADLKLFSQDSNDDLERGRNDASSEELNATGVKITFQVFSTNRDLKVVGEVKTVLTTACVRCKARVATKVTGLLNLLLSATPVQEPSEKNLGIVLGDDKWQMDEQDSEAVLDIDLDDKIYFPVEEREIDLSKYIHDSIHLEIPFGTVCSKTCKGFCIECGVNLNALNCQCKKASRGLRAFDDEALEILKKRLQEAKEKETGVGDEENQG